MLWFLKLTSPLVLVIRKGRVSSAKGRIPGATLRQVQGLLDESGIARGSIHADGQGRFHFSRDIPEDLYQRLRNILVSN